MSEKIRLPQSIRESWEELYNFILKNETGEFSKTELEEVANRAKLFYLTVKTSIPRTLLNP